jgi:endonuclease YncB( thermonuclease family)
VLVAVPVALVGPLQAGHAGTSAEVKVTKVIDGDTIAVDQDGDRRADALVRLIGIDTPEHGQCGFGKATRALRSLVGKKRVVLRSDTGSRGLRGRPERRVLVRSGGRTVDATTWLLERGLGVWMPRKGETTNGRAHHRAADRAAAAGVGWFDEDRCGAGPGTEGTLRMHVQWNADATKRLSQAERRNQEFIRIRNEGTVPVDLDGWTLRVGNDRSRRLPPGGPVAPGDAVTVHVGSGTNTTHDRYLGSAVPMLQNADLTGKRHLGSGSYLVDPDGDIRAHMTWPCTLACGEPTGGALRLSQVMVDPPGQDYQALNSEYVALTNSGTAPVRTGDMVVEIWPWVYELPADHVLHPGETVRIHGGAGRDERLTRYLDAANPPLRNNGGQVVLRTYDAIVVDCHAWGSGRCPTIR